MNIGILGATGLVGQTFLDLLKDSPLKITNLHLFASEKSQGQTIKFKSKDYSVEVISEEHLKNLDLLFIDHIIIIPFFDFIIFLGFIIFSMIIIIISELHCRI